MHYRINGFIAMLIIIFGVFKLFLKKLHFKNGWGLLFLPGLFLLLVIGQLYTTDIKEGWTLVERNLSLLLIPYAVSSIIDLPKKMQGWLIHVFIAAAFMFGVVCLVNATFVMVDTGSAYVIPNNDHFLYNIFMHHRLTDPFGIHAVYYSLYLAVANIFILTRLLEKKGSIRNKLVYGFIFLFFSVLIYLLKSANIAVGFSLCCALVVGFQYGKQILQQKKTMLIAGLGLIILAYFAYLGVKTKLEHFSFTYDMSNEFLKPMGIRLSIWDCTWQVIQENWFLGTGTGDSQHALVDVYQRNNFVIGLENDFNAHNMYLQYWMSNGIAAVGLFTLGLLILFKKALQNRNLIFLSFVVLFALFSFTESTMRTQKGMLFFVFFAALFYWVPQLWMNHQTKE